MAPYGNGCEHGSTALVFAIIYVVLIIVYQPHLLLAQTTTSGGDMGAHHPAKPIDYLLPHFKLTGWTPQWYAGMPMLMFICRCLSSSSPS